MGHPQRPSIIGLARARTKYPLLRPKLLIKLVHDLADETRTRTIGADATPPPFPPPPNLLPPPRSAHPRG